MAQIEIIYNEEKNTYNLIKDGEWYAEGDYEYIEKMVTNIRNCEIEENEEWEFAEEENGMNKRKKTVRIGILRTDDFIAIRITMFNKNKWIWIRRDVLKFDIFCIAIMLMINFLLIGLSQNTILGWHEKIIIVIIEKSMVAKYLRTRKEIIKE